ncbi:MotA/TolQ/ExbB proton channel family protein [Photobacterium galatheae]|uniref:MotA/TolQ/ExbB proton channel family protein n=1 Tax=Photobacterium galatheae TaxID=1654360 RepID=UPI00202CAA00|nr:MotA/TolQ/ExbB proton channel family protein [Photobacterium galatheae]MCM0148886.1 MotA/TolQ/ExbB proton channel family protein [Photobacterium galatheae]
MKLKTLALALSLLSISDAALAVDGLVEKTRQAQKSEQVHQKVREAGFQQTEAEIRAQWDALLAKRKKLNEETDRLSDTFSQNEKSLAQLEESLRLESGSLGELFGVVRQTAKDLAIEMDTSVTAADRQQHASVVQDIVDAKALPSLKQLRGLWQGMNEQIQASSEVRQVSVSYINGEGYESELEAYRLGSFGLVGNQGYLAWNGERKVATPYLKQPDNAPMMSQMASLSESGIQMAVVDPSRGKMLEQLAHTPTFMERLSQGGVVGKIILGLLAVGAVIALYRGGKLFWIRQQIKAQLKQPEQPGNNPLGRVLGVYDKEQNRSVEALELRLLEAIVDEQQGLERGLSMLKLLAALAPMLGLLGTVTGMIETFQVITQFGNGDPKVMAGGISMALVTTVLGLVSAMPLLLAHNLLSTQADAIRNILEKQGISLVAAEAEKSGSPA